MKTKRFAFTTLLILSAGLLSYGQKAAAVSKVDPAAPVKAAFDRLIEGIRQADAEKVMSVYENSPRILFFNNNGSATQGWEEMKRVREEVNEYLSTLSWAA